MRETLSAPFPISLHVPSPHRRDLINLRRCWDPFHKWLESLWVKGQLPLMVSPLILSTMSFTHAASVVKWLPLSLSTLPTISWTWLFSCSWIKWSRPTKDQAVQPILALGTGGKWLFLTTYLILVGWLHTNFRSNPHTDCNKQLWNTQKQIEKEASSNLQL